MLEKVTGTMRFDVKDNGRTTRWPGPRSRRATSPSLARTTPRTASSDKNRATFEKIVAGKVNPFAAVLRGTVGVEGDPELIVQFQRIFRAEQS